MLHEDALTGESIQLRRGVRLQVCHHQGQYPAIVFLHGGLGNRFNWRSQYEYFLAQQQAVLVYDLAGHGQSAPYRRYSIGRHCRDLARLLKRFHIWAPILCCHSYGVPIGLEWARRYPVSGLILMSGGTHNLDPWWEVPLMQFLTWGGRHLYRFSLTRQLTNALSSQTQHSVMQRFFDESPMPTAIHPYQALQIFWGYNFFNNRNIQAISDVPALVISGGKDPMFTYEMGTALTDCFSQAEHLHLPEAGHLLMAEYSELVNQAIAQWLKRLNG